MTARKPAMLCFFVFILCLLWSSKLAEEATVSVTQHLLCTCDMPPQPITKTVTGECINQIVKHNDVNVWLNNIENFRLTMGMVDHSLTVRLPEEQAKHDHKQKAEAAVKYRKGWFEVYNSSDDEDFCGFYTCLRLCIRSETESVVDTVYEIFHVKTLIIGRPSSGSFSSFPDGFECKITQRIVFLCNTGCGCNTTMEVVPPSSGHVGPCDSDGKHSQPSWHCEGDNPLAAKRQKTCYLSYWCSKLDCCVKYRCRGSLRDNTTNIFDCSWDQDDSPGGRCKNSVSAVTVISNNQEQSDSTETFNTPAVYYNDSIADNMNNPEQRESNTADIVIKVITVVVAVVISIIVVIAVLLCICVVYVCYHIDEYVSHLDIYRCCPQPQSAPASPMPMADPAAQCLIQIDEEDETRARPEELIEFVKREPGRPKTRSSSTK